MSGSKTTDTSSQTHNTLDPWVKGLLQHNYDQAEAVANAPFTPYTQQRYSNFDPVQTQAQGLFTGIANNQTGNDTLNSAISAAKSAAGYSPAMVTSPNAASTGYTAATVNPSLLDPNDIAKFENPWNQQVVDTTSADANHALQVQENQNAAAATKAGAWRGSALAVQNGQAQGDSNRALDSTIAGLRSAGFNTAASLAGSNVDRTNAANLFNAGATNTAGEFGANAYNAAALRNAEDQLAALQGNQAADLQGNSQKLTASSLLAAQSGDQLSQAATRASLLAAVGDTLQQHDQQNKDFNWTEFLRQLAYPAQQQAIRNSAIGLIPAVQNSSTTGSATTSSSFGLGSILGLFGDAAKLGATLSDERTKKDVGTIGYDEKGRRWVDYHYKWDAPDSPLRHGLMAQETLRTDPQAVVQDPRTGLLGIAYDKLAA